MWSNLCLVCEQSQQGYSDLEQSQNGWAPSHDRAALCQRGMIATVQVGRESCFHITEVERLLGQERTELLILYGRVSVHVQQENLQRLVQQLEHWALTAGTGQKTLTCTERGSGLRTIGTGLLRLFVLVQDYQVDEVVESCSDRLIRNERDDLTTLFEGSGTTLTNLSPNADKTPEEGLMEDVLAIIVSVGRRLRKRKELLECALAALHKP